MKCLRKLPHLKIYSIFAFLFFSFFLSAGISQDSYATSTNCLFDITKSSGVTNAEVDIHSSCNITPDSSAPLYYRFNSFSFNFTNSGNSLTCIYLGSNVTTCSGGYAHYLFRFQPRNNSTFTASDLNLLVNGFVTQYDLVSSSPTFPSNFTFVNKMGIYAPSAMSFVLSVNLDYSTDFSDFMSGGSSEPCPVCPVIPDNPYDNKFDAITKAIYTCGAVLIMLYFFFCIYKIIVKDGGSR